MPDVGQGPLAIALGGIGLGAQFVGLGALVVGRERAVVSRDRFVEIALLAPDAAFGRDGGDALGVELRGLAVIGKRLVELAGSARACARSM